MPDPHPRTILVTGAGRGLGFATALRLASAGHRLVLTARDGAKAQALAQRLAIERPGSQVTTHALELLSLASVRELAARRCEEGTPIDVLVHNAGMLFPPATRTLTADGLEVCLQAHAIAPLVLTRALLPVLSRPSRVWGLGSSLHRPGSRGVAVDFRRDDPQLDTRYHPERAYKNSKLALVWVARELERRLAPRRIHADVVCPGFVPTTAAAGAPTAGMRFVLRRILSLMPFATSVDESTEGLARLFGRTPLAEPGGRYFEHFTAVEPSEQARDDELAAWFWRWACERAGLPERLEDEG